MAQSPEPPPVKVGVIEWQKAILSTREGQQRTTALQAQFEPRRLEIEKRRIDVEAMQERLRRTGGALDEGARAKLERDIDRGTRGLNRMAEDLNLDMQDEQTNLARELGGKLNAVIQKYIALHGFAVVLEVTKDNPPAAWAAASVDVTAEIVRDYDLAHPVKTADVVYGTSSKRPSERR
jgi:outer membrane protein